MVWLSTKKRLHTKQVPFFRLVLVSPLTTVLPDTLTKAQVWLHHSPTLPVMPLFHSITQTTVSLTQSSVQYMFQGCYLWDKIQVLQHSKLLPYNVTAPNHLMLSKRPQLPSPQVSGLLSPHPQPQPTTEGLRCSFAKTPYRSLMLCPSAWYPTFRFTKSAPTPNTITLGNRTLPHELWGGHNLQQESKVRAFERSQSSMSSLYN